MIVESEYPSAVYNTSIWEQNPSHTRHARDNAIEQAEIFPELLNNNLYFVYDYPTMNIVYIIFIFLLCLSALPIMALLGVCVLMFTGFPVFFRQIRVGKNGKPFVMYKFRTMIQGAEQMQKQYEKLNIAGGPAFKIPDDPRYTRIGKFLSHTGFDELPQLFNVLKGDMSLIGPRPLPIEEDAKLTSWQRARQSAKPGIISPWVLNGYHANTFDAWMKSDIEYIRKKSFLYDVQLAIRTVLFLLKLMGREITGILSVSR